ncbi:Phosphoribosyl-dephospho-CoA transferase [Caballeronia arationis]|uniref:Phosphoribosyl-dephospho-CoA transferase n=1 Tax=Caballeronia arationis TaxID=1777142 RepID=A0A7Z7N4T6_9BURK|nr:malonate decarboxylase holo-ACP synthase [Caballeronia arationis]SAK70145.1 Phosphoribosyl-dephospho-CoA transferase [Caballeronia arationis]SOE82150.1 phosphoribosyl-dephospho-CoA transferase [Caballeronia arationis]
MSTVEEVIRPHDLLWIETPRDIRSISDVPAWASHEWLSIAPVVVRREAVSEPGLVPVGLRGRTRSERFAAFVAGERIARRVTPEALARARGWRANLALAGLPCVRALARIAPELDRLRLTWGITGSVGFALASGVSTLRQDSDLDLLLRAGKPLPREEAQALLSLLRTVPSRIDMQVDTGHGGFALAEWAGKADRILLKTGRGPVLVADPWEPGTS